MSERNGETPAGEPEGASRARRLARELLGENVLAQLNAPLAEARALPNAAYTSPDFLALERERLFARHWCLAGHVHEVASPGDVLPVDLAGMAVLLVHGEDGVIRAFQNVCRHRGARLAEAPCHARRAIVCPYHAWTYALDGRLERRPHFHGGDRHDVPGADDAGPGLLPVRCERWHHWLFVNLDGSAPPLGEYLSVVRRDVEGYDLDAARHAGTLRFEVGANWKFAMENFIEPYHVFCAHPRLHAFVPMREREPSRVEGHVMWNRYEFAEPEAGRGGGDLPYFPGLGERLSRRGVWFLVFPSFAFEVYPDHVAVLQVNPLAPDRTAERIDVYLVGDAATESRYVSGRQAVLDMWQALNREDVGLLESLQRGRAAPGYDGGALSPYWDEAARSFARLVAQRVL